MEFEINDKIINTYDLGTSNSSSLTNGIDKISFEEITVKDLIIDFEEIYPQDRVNGLLGLDLQKLEKWLLMLLKI